MIESLQSETEKVIVDIKQGKGEANNCQDNILRSICKFN